MNNLPVQEKSLSNKSQQFTQIYKGNHQKNLQSKSLCSLTASKKQAVKPKILVVEDNAINQKITSLMLIELNCEAEIARSGFQAIEMFKSGYDMVLLDIGLPDMDGCAVCELMRKDKHAGQTPIIALTACDQEIEEKCRLAGVNEFLMKPLSFSTLEKLLEQWL